MKIIGIIGSRRRDTKEDYSLVMNALGNAIESDNDEIVSGGCPQGGDRFAEILAKKYQITIKIYYAQWNTYGKSAGYRRNGLIAKDADILIACVAEDRKGGTENTISQYLKLGKTQLILV